MDECVGREKELVFLESLWEKAPISCAVCGRRHLGKTALLKKFVSDKPYIYLTGMQGLRSDNLDQINRALSKFSGKREKIADVGDLFPKLKELCGRQKAVVIIDRLSELTDNFEELSAYMRNFVNRGMNGTKMMLVVCDSDNSLFGRFYYTVELKPLSYMECKGFHPSYTPIQHLMVYAIAGGTPAYQHLFAGNPEEVIRMEFFDRMSVFSLEAGGLIAIENMSTGACAKVMSAIADGAESLRSISAKTGLPSSYCAKLIEDLEHKGIVGQEVSSGQSRRAVYSIDSNILAFYYQVVYRYENMADFGSSDEAYEMAKKGIDSYMEGKFKGICMDYVARTFEYKFIAKLRKKDDTVDDVIDFIATLPEKRGDRILVAKCRLYGEPVGTEDLEELTIRAKKVEGSNKLRVLFSGCGFTSELEKAAEKGSTIRLISIDEVYSDQ